MYGDPPDLQREAALQPGSPARRLLYDGSGARLINLSFDAGRELSEHNFRPAILQVLTGTGTLKLGADEHEARPGTCAYVPAGLVHAVRAERPLTLLLTLLP